MLRHRPCCNAAESVVLSRLSAGFFFGLRCTKIVTFGCFPRLLHLLCYYDSGYKLFLLFEICSGFYDVIVFGDFSDTRPLTRKNSSVFA